MHALRQASLVALRPGQLLHITQLASCALTGSQLRLWVCPISSPTSRDTGIRGLVCSVVARRDCLWLANAALHADTITTVAMWGATIDLAFTCPLLGFGLGKFGCREQWSRCTFTGFEARPQILLDLVKPAGLVLTKPLGICKCKFTDVELLQAGSLATCGIAALCWVWIQGLKLYCAILGARQSAAHVVCCTICGA
jgi:hypothetical protein